ncbi:Plasma membrane sulfite pump involved in sulfite metabolism [Coemansia sp. Benny D115]|nr:Plasma membrane sulfite pump involved in sulfite metabolism [Coemansia sp. Benny D115]
MDSLSSTLLLPVVTNVVAASTGAVVASAFEGSNAVAVVLVSYMLWGMGMGTAMMLVTAYLMRLTLHGLPPKEAMASAFIPLGPMGQSSYGIQILGVQALRVFPKELPQIQYLGEILHALGFTLGIFIWALAFWWLMQGIYSALYTRVHGPIPFNLGWWALIFPVGTFASTSSSLWGLTGYTFYRVVTAFMVVGLFALWVFVLLHTIWYAWSGELFKPANIRRLELASTDANSDDDGESGIIERKKKIDV